MYLFYLFLFIIINGVDNSDIFHENSKVTYKSNVLSDFFGFSVVLTDSRLIVGAPKTRNLKNASIHTGVVFSCPTSDLDVPSGTCTPWSDPGGAWVAADFLKDDMWIGASIGAIPDGRFLICAPRWTRPYNDKVILANGACYLQTQDRSRSLYPLRTQNRQGYQNNGSREEYKDFGQHLYFYGMGQAGMSIKVSPKNTAIIIGAPGLLQWTGGIVEYRYSYPDPRGLFLSQQPTANLYFTKDLGPDTYLGYSVDTGVFEKNGTTLYVAGAPRSGAGFGQVLIFEPPIAEQNPLTIRAKVLGPHLGSYFGSSVCCTDVNNDGLSDLLVGAPSFVKSNGGLPFDQGAVFVYITQNEGNNFTLKESGYVWGSGENGARFGTTLADLGDVDGDGYTDIAIAAPWENEGKGAVYIYRGGANGLKTEYTQRIIAKGAQSFGMSISSGVDVDNNHCNDLAIGALNSGTAYIYRCVPTIRILASIKIPNAMNLHQNATNFTALFCVSSPPKPVWAHMKSDLKARISVDPKENRARILGDSEYNLSINPGSDSCDEQVVEVKPTVDLSRPISIKFVIIPNDSDIKKLTKFPRHLARLSEDSVLHSSFDIQLTRDCGEDMICKPLLHLSLEPFVRPYVPGTDDKLGVIVTVLNKEEPSYGAKVHLKLPLQPKRLPSACDFRDFNVTCQIPSPLHRSESVVWEIELEYTHNGGIEKEFKIQAELEDPFYLELDVKVSKELTIDVTPKANFTVSGKALPNSTVVVTRDKFYEAGNVTFVHYYEVTNAGPSDWYRLDAKLLLPNTVNLSSPIKGCSRVGASEECAWPLPAEVSKPVVVTLRFDLSTFGDLLKENMQLNVTTSLVLLLEDQNKTASITTNLVLEPAPPIWPIIVGCIAGFLLLALIVYGLYRYGFFSRPSFERLKEESLVTEGASQAADQSPEDAGEASSVELLSEDSD